MLGQNNGGDPLVKLFQEENIKLQQELESERVKRKILREKK